METPANPLDAPPTEQADANRVGVAVGLDVLKAANGATLVGFKFAVGTTVLQFATDPQTAHEVVAILVAGLTQIEPHIRAASSGLVVPSTAQVSAMGSARGGQGTPPMRQNGGRPTRP